MSEAQQAELRQEVRLKYGTLITDEGTWELMEFAYMSGMNRAARCNDTAPVAPIGDAYIDTLKAAMNSLIFVNANYSSIPGGMSRAQIIRDLRELLAAVAAQGEK